MSEFKFACPVCGQHITADSATAGSSLECPTCYRKIVVPQAPASADSKFILSASEANKPRPPQSIAPVLEPLSSGPTRTAVPIMLVVLLLALCAAGGTLYAFRGKIFPGKTPGASAANSPSDANNEDGAAGENKAASVPAPTNNVAWKLELADAEIPDAPAAGKLQGGFVAYNRNTLQGGALGFRQSSRGLPDLSVTINFFTKQPEDLRGKTINLTTNDSPVPRVTVRWKEGKDNRSQSFTNGYALKLELGEIAGNRIPGKIYLCLPDDGQSRVSTLR